MPKLTKRLIDSASCPPQGQAFLRDSEVKGFALRLTQGSKSFVLERRIHGRSRRLTLGSYGPLTVEQARKLALAALGQVARGADPAQAKQDQRREPTFGDLADLYLERHVAHKKSAKNDRSIFKKYLDAWRPRKLRAIRRKDVADLHAELGRTHPTWANRVIAQVRVMFNLAIEWGVYQGDNPASRLRMFKEVERERFVQVAELPQLFSALREEPNPFIRVAFLMSLLTGARKMEVLRAQWPHLDLDQAVWIIPTTKADRSHYVPLPEPLVKLLKALPRLQGNPYVFPGRHGKHHLVNVLKAWYRIRGRAGLQDVRIHDLRRTLGSWLAASGENLSLIGKALNHSDPSTTAIYTRLNLDPVRVALEANAQRMAAVKGGLPSLGRLKSD